MRIDWQHSPKAEDPVGPPDATLNTLQQILVELKARMGQEFMAVTERLQSISRQARSIAELSHQATDLALRDESENAIATLQQMLSDTERIRLFAETSRTKLHDILESLNHSRDPLGQLVKLPFLLNTVGMLSRIEASRLGSGNTEVCSLATDITKLATQIDRYVTSIDVERNRLPSLIADCIGQLDGIQKEQQTEASDLVGRIQTVLGPVRERVENSKLLARSIDERYGNIRATTDKIVMSLQYEDIARQRLEHIIEGLAQAHDLHQSGDVPASAKIVLLQSSQLSGVRDLLSSSIQSLLENLRALTSNLEDLTRETTSLSEQTNEDGQTFSSVMEDGLYAVSSIYAKYSHSSRAVISSVETIIPSVASMTKGASELRRIAGAIRRTALNARIETSHLGNEGSTMRAIASEVQQITVRSDEDTRIVLEDLSAIDDALGGITNQRQTSSDNHSYSRKPEEVREEVSNLIEVVKASSQEVSGQLAALLEESAMLKSELLATCDVANRGSLLTKRIAEVHQELESFLKQTGYKPDTTAGSSGTDITADLINMYSMKSERDVHQQVFGGNGDNLAEADLGDVELF